MKIRILLFILLSFISTYSYSSHYEGGEITWTCDGNGKTIFEVKFYRDCNGIAAPTSITLTTNAPGWAGGILCSLSQTSDLSPIGYGCPTCANPQGDASAVQQYTYTSNPVILNGVPGTSGWYFRYSDCCRNASVTNLLISQDSYTVQSIMYPYNNQITNPCFDNSPQFLVPPNFASCAQNLTTISYSSYDTEFDSITYDWAPAINQYAQPINYATGYSYTSPLPDTTAPFNSLNRAAQLNRQSGTISFKSYNAGVYQIVIKVTAYKCGQKVAEVFRDNQVTLSSACHIGATSSLNTPPNIDILPLGSYLQTYSDTIAAGDSVNLTFNISDFQTLSNGSLQALTVTAIGVEFGNNFIDPSSGCPIIPCAVLDRVLPITAILQGGFHFKWNTSCAHAAVFNGCLQHMRDFNFIFKVNDNFCPVQGINYFSLNYTVRGPEIQQSGDTLLVSAPNYTLQWYQNGIPVSGATDSIFIMTHDGIYSVVATTPNGCEVVSQTINRTSVGIQNIKSSQWNLSVNPNPVTNNEFNLLIESPESRSALLRLFDINGRIVYQDNITLSNGSQHLLIKPGDLASGVYQLKVFAGDNELTKKIMIR